METEQRLNLNEMDCQPSNFENSTSIHKKNEEKRNCFVKLVKGFLQAIVHFFKLYRYNDRWDFLLLFIGIVTSIGTGFGLPLFAVVAGDTIDAFDQTPQSLASAASRNKNYMLIIGFSMFAVGSISFSVWMFLGERVSMKFREQYLKGLLKQQIQFLKGSDEQEIYEKFEEHMKNIKEAAGLKAGAIIYIIASFTIAGKIATSNGFFLSLIMVPTLPILGISGFIFSIFVQLKYSKLMRLYEKAEQKVRQSLNFLRTVKELNGQNYEVKIFEKYLKIVKEKVIIYSILAGFGAGFFSLMQYLVYCLAFWLGSHCVQGTSNCGRELIDEKYTPGDVILIFFAFFVRLDSMQQLFPSFKRIYNGTSSYEKVYKIISRKPLVCCPFEKFKEPQIDFRTMKLAQIIDHMKTKAEKWKKRLSKEQNPDLAQKEQKEQSKLHQNPEKLKIEFKNVTVFSKKDPTKKILDDVTMLIDKELICINGQSEEQQAILQLILRLYDPDKGLIFINGVDIKALNISHLRKKIGYLEKKAYIFETTIRENITMGNKDFTVQMIWSVLQELKVAETIKLLDDQLESEVGFQGKKLSERLKKKIILARILIKNPQILLFKEDYSFLSEDQQYKFYLNLNKFKHKKVLIYTGKNERIIKKADKIFVFSMGKIEAEGDFYSLPNYYREEVVIKEEIIGQKRQIQQNLYKSSLKTSKSIKDSEAMNINEIDNVSQKSDISPQKMLIEQEKSLLNRYKGKIHKRLFGYLKGNFIIYFLGFIVCLISGILYPIFTIFMSDILLDTFEFKKNENKDSFIRQQIDNPILFILWIGIVSFVVNFLEVFIFSVIAQRMGQKLRLQTLKKVLKLPLNWLEMSSLRTSFRVSQTIKIDPTIVQNLLTNFYSIIIKNSSSFIAGMIIAIIFQWRSALLGIAVLPMMMLSGYLSVIFYRDEMNLDQKDYINSAQIVTESILNMKAIHTEGCQQIVLQKYKRTLEEPLKKAKKRIILCSMLFGLSQLLIFVSYTIMFYFGTIFYRDDNTGMTTLNLLTAIFAVIWSGWTSGANFIRLPAKKSCEIAAAKIFLLLDQVDEEQNQVKEKSKLLRDGIKGNIEFKDVTITFKELGFYIDKVNFNIEEKNQLAFFSTTKIDINPIIDLLYRFSEPEDGQIFIDNERIKDYEISYLRSCLGTIRGEPAIFKASLRQNIAYNKGTVTDQEIYDACTLINATQLFDGKSVMSQASINTIQELDETGNIEWNGLDTVFNQNIKILALSQKQTIIMSRVILRNPKILLINSQTSREIRQNVNKQALKNIMKDRTSIFMPHHTQNLSNTNVIMVLERDKITPVGNYQEMLKNKSIIKRIKRNFFDLSKSINI